MTHLRRTSLTRILANALLVAAALLVSLPRNARAQFVYQQDFKGTTAAGWVFGSGSGSPFTPVLTAAAGIDTVGNGWLRMTDLQANEATYARLNTPIPSANNNITVTVDLAMWNKGTGGAADGMTISLRDASVAFAPGAYGGSLGYANGHGIDGMAGGYFSLGIDNYGNFSNPTEDRNGGSGFVPNAIATRGPGVGQTGYDYLGGTGDLSTAPYNLGQLDFANNTTRPVQTGVDFRQLVFNLDSSSILTVSMKFGAAGTLTQIYTADLSGFDRPENLELVYTGSTGGAQQINELRGLIVTTTAAPVGNVYYSNYANDNKWGTGANWGDAVKPNLGLVPGNTANIIFSNNAFSNPAFQLTTAQNVDLQQNRTAASIQFDAPFNYTLQGYQLTLDNGANSTAITVTSAQPGGAHTIQSNVALNSNLNINTNTGTALVFSGNINAGTKTFTLNNLGTTTFAGQITGSGTMTQTASGTTIISGNSSATYTGNLDIQKGTLQLGASNVLNAATNLSLSSVTGTGTFNLAGNSQTLGSLTFASGGNVTTGAGILTLGGNVTSNASATQAVIAGNLDLGGANRTFTIAQGAANPDMAISANITSSGGGLIKAGAGALVLSGNSSYSGPTSITAGSVIAANNHALGTTGGMTTTTLASGTTLGLQGGINLSNFETILVSGTGDTGLTGNLGAITNLSGDNAIGGSVVLTGATRLGAASGTTLTLSGPISQSGGAHALTANGTGTIVLGATSTYAGTTTVNSGTTLVAAANKALGDAGAGTTVASTATLGFQGNIDYSATESLSVSGTGAAGRNGAIDNLSGTNRFNGPITLAGATTVGAAAGSELTLTGIVSGANALTAGGTGVVVLAGANTYSGTTTIASGATLVAANASALGNGGTTTTVANGGTLGVQGDVYVTGENVTLNGAGVGGIGALYNRSGTNVVVNPVALGSASTIGAAAGSELYLLGLTGSSALTKNGAGTVTIAGAAGSTGSTTVTDGTLRLAGSNGSLLNTSAVTVTNATLSLDNSLGDNTNRLSANVTLNEATLNFQGVDGARSAETIGTLVLGTGDNVLSVNTGAGGGSRADLTLADITRSGTQSLVIRSEGSVGIGANNLGTVGSARVFITTNTLNGSTSLTGATIAAPIALPGFITVTNNYDPLNPNAAISEFAEYTGDYLATANTSYGNGIRAVASYYTGGLGLNVNSATANVLLSSSSTAAEFNLTRSTSSSTTTDGNLKLTDITNLSIANNRTLTLQNGGIIKTGGGTTTFDAPSTGKLQAGTNAANLSVTVDGDSTLILDPSIIGTKGLVKGGNGTLQLTATTNTYTGTNYLNGGVLKVATEAQLGNVANDVTFNGGTLAVTNSFTSNSGKVFTVANNNTGGIDVADTRTLTLNNTANVLVTGNSNSVLTKTGLGTLVVSNANTFPGQLEVAAGTVQVNNVDGLGATGAKGAVTLSGGTLALRNDASTAFNNNLSVTASSAISIDRLSAGTNRQFTLGTLALNDSALTVTGGNGFDLTVGATTITGDTTINANTSGSDVTIGAISGTGSIKKGGAAILTLTGANTYTGLTGVGGGTLRVGNATAVLPSGTDLVVTAGTFDQNGFNQTVASLAGAGNITMGAGNLTAGNAFGTSFSGVISGSGEFTKTGTGNLTLGGANTFTGALNLNQGTITYGAWDVIANSVAVTIAAPATLNLAGFGDKIGSLAGAGTVQLGNGSLYAGGNDASTSFTGIISGAGGSLVKAGTGTMTLTGGNTYTGTTSVDAGTLAISNSAALGSGNGLAATGTTVISGATLQLSGAINVANEYLSLAGTGTSSNGALQNVSGNNTLGGPVVLGAAASVVVNAGNLTLSNTLTNGGNLLTVGGAGNTIANGAIVGAGGLTKTGPGALILNNTGNTYSGATALNAGSIQIGANGAGPASSAVTVASGATLDVNNKTTAIASLAGVAGSSVVLGTGTLSAGSNNTNTTYAGVISGAGGGFTKDGTGTTTLSGANTYTGATTVNAGTVTAGANNVLSNQTAVTVAGGATFNLANTTQAVGSIAGAGAITLGSGQLVAGANNTSTTYSGAMTGTGTFTKGGTGTLTLTGANSYTGATTVTGGNLTLGASNVLSNSTSVTVNNGATLALGAGVTEQIAGLTTSATSTLDLSANAVLTSNRVTNTTLSGNFTGTGTLAFTGGGNLTLGSDINFANGTLAFGGTTIGSTPTTTLFLGGNDLNIGTLHITGDTILDFGNSTASVLTSTNFTIDAGVKITVNNWVQFQDYFFVNGTWSGSTLGTRGQGSETQVTFNGNPSSNTGWQNWDHQITPTPEPSTYGLMLGAALGGLMGFRRWKKSRAAAV